MQLILKEDVPKLGHAGEQVSVKAGFGRNYLIPQGLAALATPHNVRQLQHQKRLVARRVEKAHKEALSLAERLEGRAVTFERQAGEKDRLFGSVSAKDVALGLAALGIDVPRRAIQIERPIKQLGIHSVEVRLHADVQREIKVWIVAKA